MALEDEVKRTNDQLERLVRQLGGSGGGFGRSGTASSTKSSSKAGEDMIDDLRELGQQAKDVEANIKKLNKQFLPFAGSLEAARKANSQLQQDIESVNRRMEELDTALDTGRYRNKEINDATRQSLELERSKLKVIKTSTDYEQQKQSTISSTFDGLKGIGQAYQDIAMAAVAGMSQISGAIQAGGNGFNLLGAAAEYQADMAKAQTQLGTSAMKSVGQSMEGLGAAGRLAGGALTFLAQAAQHNAELRREAARMRNQLFMNMGSKFSDSFMKAGAAGAVFTAGATGMNAALEGSRITFAEFGDLVKRNNAAFHESGMSVEEMTKKVAATSASFKKSGIDGQLMKLGLGLEQQADLIVNVTSEMGKSAQLGGAKASQAEIEKATIASAQATTMMAQIMGDEAAQRKKAAKDALEQANTQVEINKLSAKFGPAYANGIKDMYGSMNATEQKIMNEMIASGGQVRSKDLAILMSQSPEMAKRMQSIYTKTMSGGMQGGAKDYIAMKKQSAQKEAKELEAAQSMLQAAILSGNPDLVAHAKHVAEMQKESAAFNKEAVDAAEKSAEGLGDKDKQAEQAKKDPLGDALTKTALTMNDFQKKMEDYVIKNLPTYTNAMLGELKKMEDAFKGVVHGLNPLADNPLINKIVDFLSKYGMLVMLAVQALPMFTNGIKMAKAGLEKLAAAREMKSLKAEANKPGPGGYSQDQLLDKNGKPLKGAALEKRIGKLDSTGAPKAMEAPGGGGGMMSKMGGIAKLAGGAMALYNVASTAMSAYGTVKEQQSAYEEAKASGDEKGMAEARAAQGEAVGGAVGSVAGGALGMALGGPIGAAVGSYLGEMAGGMLGKYIGPHWDSISKKAGEMWDKTGAALSSGWTSMKEMGSKFGTSIMEFASKIGTSFMEIGGAFGRALLSAGKTIFDYFGKFGEWLWSAIKKTPIFMLGSYIWDSIAKTDLGGKIIGIFTKVTDFFKGLLDGLVNFVKTGLMNILPGWAQKLLGGGGGETTPPPQPPASPSAQPAQTQAKPKPSAPAVPTTGPNGEKFIVMPDGRRGFGDPNTGKFYPLIGDKIGSAEDYKTAYNKAAPKTPPATTNAANQGTQNASKQGEARKDTPTTPPAAEKKVSGAVPEVSKPTGQVTEKDIPRLMADTLKLNEYVAKQNARMLDMLAAVAENTKRTTSATEKMARNG